tara:strand:+ start:9250 stop:10167 length:918 start_codon:yes stop_codon:yes gene_type:complete
MNYKKACKILQFEKNDIINESTIKKQYRMLALIYHPDKNKGDYATEKFREANEAYEYLLKYEGYMDTNNIFTEDFKENIFSDNTYSFILFKFLNSISEDNGNNVMNTIINKLTTICEDKAMDLLNNLDKNTLIKVYKLLSKYKEAFHFNNNYIDKIKDLVISKTVNDERIILNPSLEDLIEQKLYKLNYRENIYYIPLWHHEVVYDISDNELYVSCEPNIPQNMKIDDKNNIYINVSYPCKDMFEQDIIYIDFCNKKIPVYTKNLHIKHKQTIRYANHGIPTITSQDVYDVSKLSDIFINITVIT